MNVEFQEKTPEIVEKQEYEAGHGSGLHFYEYGFHLIFLFWVGGGMRKEMIYPQ